VASRYDIAYDIAAALWQNRLANKYQDILDANHEHAVFFGEDLIK
jgi:hypothetical protein